MKNKLWVILVAIILVAGIITGIVLPSVLKKDDDSDAHYNIIFTNSSIPPTLAAMDSIIAGGDTYAVIQRGKTYAGIGKLGDKGFTNSGFSTTSQDNTISTKVQDLANLVKRLKNENKKAKFNIYVTDFDAFAGFAIGIYGGLQDSDYKVVMIEDGSSTYSNFRSYYIEGKLANENLDEPFAAFKTELDSSVAKINDMKRDSQGAFPGSELILHNPKSVYALATLSNAEYRVQNKNILLNDLATVSSSRLAKIYNGTDNEYRVNIKSYSISETMTKFTAEQKETYLTLSLGDSRELAYNLLTRTKDSNDQNVSTKKLIYIGSRTYNYDYALVEDLTEANYSTYIVDYASLQTLAENGDKFASFLTSEYTEADWTSFKALMPASYNEAYTLAFNKFQEYRYAFSWVLSLYGGEENYDLLYKGHPSELVDTESTWKDNHYTDNGTIYKHEMYTLVNHFHFEDTLGKRIGVLPGGAAAENFAYLGINFSICGLDSSTYTGYETSVPVEFIIGGGTYSIYNANTAGRYNAGTLLDSEGATTLILNKGNMLKLLGRDEEAKAWIAENFNIDVANINNYDLDRTGLLVYSDAYVEANGLEDNKIRRTVVFEINRGASTTIVKTVENIVNGTHVSSIVPTLTAEQIPTGYTFTGWSINGTDVWNSYFNTYEGEIRFTAIFTAIPTTTEPTE